MEKYIFLDIDGVLNSNKFYCETRGKGINLDYPMSEFDPDCVAVINDIVESTKAKVVVSSSWRFDNRLPDTFKKVGFKFEIFSITPFLDDEIRGEEIKMWLKKKASGEYSYCIIDDDEDMLEDQLDNFVHVDYMDGLTKENYEKIIKILNNAKM